MKAFLVNLCGQFLILVSYSLFFKESHYTLYFLLIPQLTLFWVLYQNDEKERLKNKKMLAHDLLGGIHSIGFYLSQKILGKKSIEGSDLNLLFKELNQLELITLSEFSRQKDNKSYKTLDEVLSDLQTMVLFYQKNGHPIKLLLPQKHEGVSFHISAGKILRVFGNLLKNMALHGVEGIIQIEMSDKEVIFCFKNQIKNSKNKESMETFGLASVKKLANELGADYLLKTDQLTWSIRLSFLKTRLEIGLAS